MSMKVNLSIDKRPVMIALEGLDGSGKSTMLGMVTENLTNSGCRVGVYHYTDIHSGMIGRSIRSLYKSTRNQGWFTKQFAKIRIIQEILFAIQAYQNLLDLGRLQDYDLIISDRCAVSAYVAHIENPSKQKYRELLLDIVEISFVPDYVIYLLISPIAAQARISKRGMVLGDEQLDKLLSMEANYKKLISGKWSPRGLRRIKEWCIVNAEQDLSKVENCIEEIVYQLCRNNTTFNKQALKI